MFLKQYNYKPRSGSQGSADGQPANTASSPTEATTQNQNTSGATAAAIAGRRRSSATDKFAGLHAVKRNSQDNGDKKAGFADQKPGGAGGVLGSMWTNFTKGT